MFRIAVSTITLLAVMWGAGCSREPTGPRHHIAVLPFQAEGTLEPEAALGLTQEVIAALASVEALSPIALQVVRDATPGSVPPPAWARRLKVGTVIVGKLRYDGDRLEVALEARDAASRRVLFESHHEETGGAAVAMVARVIEELVRSLGHSGVQPPWADQPSLATLMTYLRGQGHWGRSTLEHNIEAIATFREAVTLAPDFAPAHAGLANALAQRSDIEGKPVWADSALAAAAIALSLAPDNPDALRARGWAHLARQQREDALKAFARALDARPGDVYTITGASAALLDLGEFHTAAAYLQRAVVLNPLSTEMFAMLGLARFGLGELDVADVAFDRALELDPSNMFAGGGSGYTALARGAVEEAKQAADELMALDRDHFWALHLAGDAALAAADYVTARTHFQTLRRVSAAVNPFTCRRPESGLGYAMLALGETREGRQMLDMRFHQNAVELGMGSTRYEPRYEMAAIKAAMDQPNEACEWLDQAVERGWPFVDLARNDPLMGSLRGQDCFEETLRSAEARKRAAE